MRTFKLSEGNALQAMKKNCSTNRGQIFYTTSAKLFSFCLPCAFIMIVTITNVNPDVKDKNPLFFGKLLGAETC